MVEKRFEDEEIPRIHVAVDRPFKVVNLDCMLDGEGNRLPVRPVMHLCRCGASRKKPYCDGSHQNSGIRGGKEPDRVRDRTVLYAGREITIHDNRGICSHDGSCVRLLPGVFRKGYLRWIDPDGAPVEEIIRVIGLCPSGALSYSIDGVHHTTLERPPCIRVATGGPLEIQGGIRLEDDQGCRPEILEHYTLCRCGRSRNRPFCDGSHEMGEKE